MSVEHYTVQQVMNIYAMNITRGAIVKAEDTGSIPKSIRQKMGTITRRVWAPEDLPRIGEKYGFISHLAKSKCIVFFTTKGGVLKTTLAFHLARIAALHNIKTCVVGLDLQNDITRILSEEEEPDDDQNIEEALLNQPDIPGIASLLDSNDNVINLVKTSDIPTLSYIPEGPELIRLERQLHLENRREGWLRKKVVEPLKKHFELIVIDCPPNWNLLVSNALCACDVLVSPVECRVNQFRNLAVFQDLIEEYRKDMDLHFRHIYVPTRFSPMRRINSDIRRWYLKNITGVIDSAVRESNISEEAIALRKTVFEHLPKNMVADEMRQVIKEIWFNANSEEINHTNNKKINFKQPEMQL